MNNIIIIGIDSLDPYLLNKFIDHLPNFKKLIDESPTYKMKSIFPPDTIPAWISIYTGQNPAKHGIIYTFDLFKSDWKNINSIDTEVFKNKTFWDIINKYGKKTCILFPQSAFPPWKIDGIMVSRTLYPSEELNGRTIKVENGGVMSYPKNICENYITNHLGTLSGNYPGFDKLKDYIEKAKRKIIDQSNFGLKIYQSQKWDLFFIYFSELDLIQHFFWRYYDKEDPTYPINNPYENVIEEFYKLFDTIIGKFLMEDSSIKIVMSDHGHKMRPPKTVNINEYLRRKGYIKYNSKLIHIEKIKKRFLDFIHEKELTYWLVRIGKINLLSGTSKKLYTSSSVIDIINSSAYLSYFTGAKSYSEGGIHINDSVQDYSEFRYNLIKEISEIRDSNNESVFEWIKNREDLYSGKNIGLYPDIIFKLKDKYGVYWSINVPIIGTSYEHNLSSGGHKEDAVLLINDIDKKEVIKNNINLMDVAPTILDFFDIDWRNFDFDGKSIYSN